MNRVIRKIVYILNIRGLCVYVLFKVIIKRLQSCREKVPYMFPTWYICLIIRYDVGMYGKCGKINLFTTGD